PSGGPQGQAVSINRFPVTFRACRTPSKKVHFTCYGDWVGESREYSSISIFPEMRKLFESNAWGMSTNYYNLQVLDEAGPGDIVEARVWGERGYGAFNQGWRLKGEWIARA